MFRRAARQPTSGQRPCGLGIALEGFGFRLERLEDREELGDHQQIQWVFDQIRNLSQGFGSYSADENEIDAILDQLFIELQAALISTK